MPPHLREHSPRGVFSAAKPPLAAKPLVSAKFVSVGPAVCGAVRSLTWRAISAADGAICTRAPGAPAAASRRSAELPSESKEKHGWWTVERKRRFFSSLLGVDFNGRLKGSVRAEAAVCWAFGCAPTSCSGSSRCKVCLGNSRDIKELHRPEQLDRGFQLTVCWPLLLCFSDDGNRTGSPGVPHFWDFSVIASLYPQLF